MLVKCLHQSASRASAEKRNRQERDVKRKLGL